MLRTIEAWTRWSRLRSIGNSHLVRASIAVPLLGYLLLADQWLGDKYTIIGQLPTWWRLVSLYLGLSLVGVASALYTVCCPQTIQRYRSAPDYYLLEGAYFRSANNLVYLKHVVREGLTNVAPWKATLLSSITDPTVHDDGVEVEDQIIALMSARWHRSNISLPIVRVFAGLLYTVGFAVTAIPTLVTFVQVCNVTLKRLNL